MPKSATFSGVRRQRHEVLGDRASSPAPSPASSQCAGGGGVGDGLDGGERLRRDDEQRLGRVQVAHRLVQIGAVDVGHEADRQVAVGEGAQRLVRHRRAEVGAADADVDDVLDALAGVAGPLARADPVGEGGHLVEDGVHARARRSRRRPRSTASRGRAQRGVQHRAVLGDVDLLAAEHRVPQPGTPRRGGQLAQQPQRLVGDQVLGVVEVEVADLEGVAGRRAAGRRRTAPADARPPAPPGACPERSTRASGRAWYGCLRSSRTSASFVPGPPLPVPT